VELWARIVFRNFAEMTPFTSFKDLLNAANLQHEIDGFTFPPKEGIMGIFSPEKSEGFGRI
jgi:hypothetical protein